MNGATLLSEHEPRQSRPQLAGSERQAWPTDRAMREMPWVAATSTANGRSDILWRNDDGTISEWQMKVERCFPHRKPGQSRGQRKVAGIGDFNGDGRSNPVAATTCATRNGR